MSLTMVRSFLCSRCHTGLSRHASIVQKLTSGLEASFSCRSPGTQMGVCLVKQLTHVNFMSILPVIAHFVLNLADWLSSETLEHHIESSCAIPYTPLARQICYYAYQCTCDDYCMPSSSSLAALHVVFTQKHGRAQNSTHSLTSLHQQLNAALINILIWFLLS